MFEKWYLDELISKTIQDVWKLTDYFLLKLIYNIFENTKIILLLKDGTGVSDIIKKNNYPDKVFSSIKWMLDRLTIDDFVKKISTDKYQLTTKEMDYNLADIKEKAKNMAPTSIAAFNMLELMANNYPDYLLGKKTGVDIIFSPDNIEITNEYYSNNLFYNVHNICGAKIVNWDIDSRTNPVIYEIGGGLGGGTKQFLIQRLKDNKPINNFTYHFTDVANKMLRTTKRALVEISDNIDSFNFRKLDFNKDFSEQDIQQNSVDLFWGVNAAHVAYDLRFTLTEFYKALKKGGSIIISETVRPIGNTMIQQEFLLNTLDDYWNVKLDDKIRPRYGFMDWTDWITAFKEIGFEKVESIPDMSYLQKQYDNCYVAVIRATK